MIRSFCLTLSLFALLHLSTTRSSGEERPNILLICLDDLGYADVGFNADLFGVETDIVTPHIDAMANTGTVFKQAYVAHPFCGPSRMALMTGRMPHVYGGQKNLPNESLDLEDYNEKGAPESETFISTVLQDAGYFTGCIGKWHLGVSAPQHPNARGFDHFFGFLGGGHQYFPWLTDAVEPKVNDYQYFLEKNGEKYLSPEGEYLTDMLSDEAVDFIGKSATDEKPFFLYLAYNAPHSPLQGRLEDLQQLFPDHEPENPKNGVNFQDYEGRQNYIAMMYAVDRGIASIEDALKDPNGDGDSSDSLRESTLIVFISDNGGKILQAGNNAPLQNDKGSTMEGGIRVPMFMRWPSQVPAGGVFDHPVNALDFYPTFAALGDATVPEEKVLDGTNLWDDFQAGKNPHPDEPMFWLRHHGGGNEVAIRIGNLKAYRKQFGKWSVFEISTDVGETENVAASHQEILARMIAHGKAWGETHIDPQWHDNANSLKGWIENEMPRYERTFQMR